MKVLGRKIELSDGRFVFLGTSEEQTDAYYFGFQSKEGEQLKFILSREAKDALAILLKDPIAGMPLKEFPEKKIWQVVKFDDTMTLQRS